MPKKKASRRRQTANTDRTNTKYISQDATAALTSIAGTIKSLSESVYLSGLSQIRMEEELHHIAGWLHSCRLELDDISRISSPIWKIADILERPTFWQRVRIRLMNWRWRRRIAKGLPQKEWSEKTREALMEWEHKANGATPEKDTLRWRSVWQ